MFDAPSGASEAHAIIDRATVGAVLPAKLVVLVSGAGTNMQALLDACADKGYGAHVAAVGSDRDDAHGLDRAAAAGVPAFTVRPDACADRQEWDRALAVAVAAYDPDLVVFAGFMKIVGENFLGCFPRRVINTHPALSPAFPGAHAVRDTLAYGTKITGVTVHLVDVGVDSGPVLDQRAVPVMTGDDQIRLHERIKGVERQLLVEVVGRMVRTGYRVEGRTARIGDDEPQAPVSAQAQRSRK